MIYRISDSKDCRREAAAHVCMCITVKSGQGRRRALVLVNLRRFSCSVIYLSAPTAASFTEEINVTVDMFIGVR